MRTTTTTTTPTPTPPTPAPPPGPTTVSATPLGAPAPAGGWKVEYADGFGAPLGTGAGQDNTLWPNRFTSSGCGNEPPYNTDEMEVFNCTADSVDAAGLHLTCRYTPGVTAGQNYTCGSATTSGSVPGHAFFRFATGGRTWAIQTVAQFPPNSGEADPGWWAENSAGWPPEIDFFEGFGASAGPGGSWCHATSGNGYIGTTMPTWITSGQIDADSFLCRDFGFDPSAGLHTYTTVIYPNDTVSEWVDGRVDAWSYIPSGKVSSTVIGPPGNLSMANAGTYSLQLSYGLRTDSTGNPDPYFKSGTRSFTVRSIAVYEDAASAGAGTVNGGLVAPGTTVR